VRNRLAIPSRLGDASPSASRSARGRRRASGGRAGAASTGIGEERDGSLGRASLTGSVTAAFIYLGTGNWVDFVDIPTGATLYQDSLTAKQAVMGASAVMAPNDVYAVKLSATNTAWIQVQTVVNSVGPSVQFLYRLNRHSYPYLKFDVTAYGDMNCNTSGVTLY